MVCSAGLRTRSPTIWMTRTAPTPLALWKNPAKSAGSSKNGAGEGNRTLVCSLGSCRSTIELHPRRGSATDAVAPADARIANGDASPSRTPRVPDSKPLEQLFRRERREEAQRPLERRARARLVVVHLLDPVR